MGATDYRGESRSLMNTSIASRVRTTSRRGNDTPIAKAGRLALKTVPRNGPQERTITGMPGKSSGGLGLPRYHRSEKQQKWVASERRTANLIQSFWKAAGQKQRNDPVFLCLLVQCGWSTGGARMGEIRPDAGGITK